LAIRQQAQQQTLRNQEVEEWRRFVERVQDVAGNFLYDLFSGQINSVQDILTGLKNFFLRTLAEMVAAAVANPIAITIRTVLGGLAGLASPAAAAAVLGTVGGVVGPGGTPGPTGSNGADTLLQGAGLLSLFGPESVLGKGFSWFGQQITNAGEALQGW